MVGGRGGDQVGGDYLSDRGKVPDRVIGRSGHHVRRKREWPDVADDQRVAVRGGASYLRVRKHASGARPVLNHHRLPEPLGKMRGDQTGGEIEASARWETHQDLDRLDRIDLRRGPGCEQHRGKGSEQSGHCEDPPQQWRSSDCRTLAESPLWSGRLAERNGSRHVHRKGGSLAAAVTFQYASALRFRFATANDRFWPDSGRWPLCHRLTYRYSGSLRGL